MAVYWRMNYAGAADCVAAGSKNSGSQRQNGAGTFNDSTVAWPIPVVVLPDGRRGLTFTIPNNYRRYEFTPPDAINKFDEGQYRTFGFSFRLAPGFPTNETYYQVIAQIHAAPGSGSPPVAIEILRNRIELSGGANKPILSGGNTGQSLAYRRTLLSDVEIDRTYNCVFGVFFTSSGSNAYVDVWIDGIKVADQVNVPCATVWGTDVANDGGSSYVKWGIYHGQDIPGLTLHESDHAIGDTFADVDSRIAGTRANLTRPAFRVAGGSPMTAGI